MRHTRRGFAVESAGARICRAAGGRVVTNAMFREFDLADPDPEDRRRIEILADGLPLTGGGHTRVPRAGQPSRQSAVGGPGWGGWRPVVGNNS